MQRIELTTSGADFHVHLRDGRISELVTPCIRQGGVDLVLVMPNLVPPITTVQQALEYRERLQQIEPNVTYLMTLYLCRDITPEVVARAKQAGIVGIKSYPKGLTTNSEAGVLDYESFYPVFEAMQEHDLVLNIHGEAPSSESTTILNAEAIFLPTLLDLHRRFPRLRIVLEHCTTAAAIETVRQCSDKVAGTITAHHLYLTVDAWADNPFSYCKPVAKLPQDRQALIDAAISGDPKFFLGTDSAPHPRLAKKADRVAAGVFTQPYALPYVAQIFEEAGAIDKLEAFVCQFGRNFYHQTPSSKRVVLEKKDSVIQKSVGEGDEGIVPFMAGETLHWTVSWK